MDFDAMVNKLSLKKMLVLAVFGLIVFWVIRMVMVFAFLSSFANYFTNFNANFDKAQNEIHGKIESIAEDIERGSREFDKRDESFIEHHKEIDKIFDRVNRRAEIHLRNIEGSLSHEPYEISKQQQTMNKKRGTDFQEETKKHKPFFSKDDTGVKEENGVICVNLLGSQPREFDPTSSRSVEEQKAQYEYWTKWRQDTAKKRHCEKYL